MINVRQLLNKWHVGKHWRKIERFKCLKPGHTKPNCKSNTKYKCRKEGFHHTALCNPNKFNDNPPEEKVTCLVKKNTKILLQTENTLVADKNETQVCAIKLLLDAGSQVFFLI